MNQLDTLQDQDLSLSEWLVELSGVDPSEIQEMNVSESLPSSTPGPVAYKKQPIPVALRWQVFERDNFTCQKCGSRQFLSADHIIPESKGGPTILENLQTLCRSCNSRKGTQ